MKSLKNPAGFPAFAAALQRSSSKLGEGIGGIFGGRRLDGEALNALGGIADCRRSWAATSARLVGDFAKNRFGKDVTELR